MARQARVEYPGAFHHVMSRGNDGIPIFRDDTDRILFLTLLVEEAERSRWILHDYCLMTNHYHFAIETPECTLSTRLHRLLGRYVQGVPQKDATPTASVRVPRLDPLTARRYHRRPSQSRR